MQPTPSLRNVHAARKRIAGRIHQTPLLSSDTLNQLAGVEVLFKCENLQKSGSFKYRGALNSVLALPAAVRKLGVATHSSGNHGAALAAVAQRLNLPATIVVPHTASKFKQENIRRYGGRIVHCGKTLKSRENKLAEVLADTGASYIPPYDHFDVIAGQGTCALEILEQTTRIDEIWLPVGGGGLAAGTVLATSKPAASNKNVQVVGVEPTLAGEAQVALQTHQRQLPMSPVSIADGLRASLGLMNFKILDNYQLPIHLVSEQEIVDAQRLAMSCLKVVLEPSSAVPLAALLKHGSWGSDSRRVVVILTGGNVELPL
ncbi:MAG: pyridoxal-phosphate dependent enzyme [Pseudomonadaceae bacterium]|nr:pyridoxal-phosphate dependent enzyme [Pseudomonadaceae bacterium]